ncbi:SseB family protein [Brevibacterium daeguense]|nr:SseB family protein [Brevibacterium daeguense]
MAQTSGAHRSAAQAADSAGTPWAGRDLKPNPFSGDTGQADPSLRAALRAVNVSPMEPQAHIGVVEALRGARVYAPVMPTAVEHSTDERGLVHDNRSEMAMVRLASEDGRECTPCFADIPALTSWGTTARPVPIEMERLGVAAIQEGAQLVVIDPGSTDPFLLRRTALWAFVQGHTWRPAWADARVARLAAEIAGRFGWIEGLGVAPGTRNVHISGPEVALVLRTAEAPGSDRLNEFRQSLSAHEEFVALVDSMVISFAA